MCLIKDYAKKYIEAGFLPFPLAANNKTPATKNGFKDAINDIDLIDKLFDGHNGNIGITFTPEYFAIDLDRKNGLDGVDELENIARAFGGLPDTLTQITPSGGEHRIYRKPADIYIPNTSNILAPGIDIRTSLGYIVVEPSSINGKEYSFLDISILEDAIQIADAPGWMLDLLGNWKRKPLNAPQAAIDGITSEGGRNDLLTRMAGSMRRFGANQGAIYAALQAYNSAQCKPPLPESEIKTISKSIARYEPEIDLTINKSASQKDKKKDIEIPENILNPPGILGEITKWISDNSRKPQPQFDVQSGIAFVATIMGRKYITDNANWPSLFLLNIAKSASGKEHAKWAIEKLLEACSMPQLIGPSGYTSAAGLLSTLHAQPSHIAIIDEFGKMLESASVQRNNLARESLTQMMEVWGRCDGTLRPKGYSTHGLSKKDIDAMQSRIVRNPALSLLGMSTPETFFDSIGSSSARDGFLNRIIIVESNIGRQPSRQVKQTPVPEKIIEWANHIVNAGAAIINLADSDPATCSEPTLITTSDEANGLFDIYEVACIKLMDENEKNGLSEMYGRSKEQAMKLSMIVALCDNNYTIKKEHAQWAIDYVSFYTNRTVTRLLECVSDSDFQSIKKQVLTLLEKAGKRGLTLREISKSSRKFDAIDHKAQFNVLQSLKTSGDADIFQITAKRNAWCAIDHESII